jgi:hypothetical protein
MKTKPPPPPPPPPKRRIREGKEPPKRPKFPKDGIEFNYYTAKKLNRIVNKMIRIIVIIATIAVISLIFTWLLTLNIL